MTTPTEYPLCWPAGRPRREGCPLPTPFQTTLHKAVKNVTNSLRLFAQDTSRKIDPNSIVFSSNMGGLSQKTPDDPAVAVYFDWDGQPRCFPVDRYATVAANVQAIHHLIEAKRTDFRHGGLQHVRASFEGHKALPAPISGAAPWYETLGVPRKCSRAQIQQAYRNLAAAHHPDRGGDEAKMKTLNAARDAALKEIKL